MSRRRKGHGCGITVLVLLFIFILAGGGLGVLFARKYMPSNELADKSRIFGIKDGQVALILDNQVQEEKGIYEGGQVYLPVDWVNEHLNQRFYWDEGEKLLVYALPDSIVYADESAQGEKGPLFKVTQDGMYLSLGVVVNYTDIRTQAFATSQIKRVFIDTSWQPYDTAVLKKTGQVRVKGGVKSQIITEAAAGETVDVLETMEKWSRVRTSDGYIGYVENRKLEAGEQVAPVSTFEAPVYTSISMDGKVRLGFHQVTRPEGNNTLESYVSNARGMNVIVPTWFNVVSGDGTYTSLASRDYVDKAHDMGLKVWAMVENVSTEESVKNLNTKTLMSSTSTRKKLIEKLMNEADTYGFDGFNLDFESLKAEAGPHYVQFIREMSVACRNKGLVLSVDNYVPSSYTAFYNRREQGIVADYVIVMGYDEHYAGGEAGSVSSIPYVREGIENTLKEVPKEKVINAVPFYTRVWTVNEGKTSSKAYGISDARQWVEENQVELSWDKLLGQYYGETVSGSGQQYIWMEEEDSMKLKIDLIKEFDLAGVACWKLGFEPADIWDIVSEVK
ncbi:MAG: glycosyl hydrolase family 18 protein [Enterocloster clostridioformis]|nr:glycosyl hydrolase family 18 protein [Enterocloster clostridioformis]